ncbi:MAG TPA: amino acid adenylation domain-containing protein, partial [Herpetosiphonaceae bacterium]
PLDAGGPVARAEAVLAHARPALLITSAALAGSVDGSGAELVLVDDSLFAAEAAAEPVPPPAPVAAGDPAYVIYTSGSTGQPNGVRIGHGALDQFVAGATARYGVTAADRVLQFAPLHFDASVEELFLALCAGATLVLRTEAMLQSIPRFLAACAASAISVLDLPTAFWHELAFCVSEGQAALPAALRCVIIGGEAALPERIARWRRVADPRILLLNTYGPTEATVVATVAALDADPGDEPAPIGLPLPGVACAIVDERGLLARPGAEGELCLLGGGLALGYLGDPALTDRRFVALAELPGAPRAYRTGDLVRRRADGQLVYLGRCDDELKISGHRVNPAEVETALLALPGVREAAVIGVSGPGGLKQLAAHVAADESIDPAALRRGLLERLPAALVPARIIVAAALPKTRSGKIDRALLRAAPAAPAAEAPQATELERQVLRVWAEVLGRADLVPGDDFFALGGQSLQTIQVATRLGAELGREIAVATLFRHPTAAGLAQALDAGPAPVPAADEELAAL